MFYIFNKTISDSNSLIYSLTVLYGINRYQSKKICKNIGVNPQINPKTLKENHINSIVNYTSKHISLEQTLRKETQINMDNLLEIKNIRAVRQRWGLPAHGQRTHSNGKTAKKNRKFIVQKKISFKKKK